MWAKLKFIRVAALFVFFAFYILLEINLNLALIDLYSQPMSTVFGSEQEFVQFIELMGRVITGFGLSLALVSFIPKLTVENCASAMLRNLFRPVLFVVIWMAMIPSLRLFIDAVVDNATPEQKLSAVRSVVFKEAYLRNMVTVSGLEALNTAQKENDDEALVVSLIPSLAYFSPRFNGFIANQMDEFALNFIESNQRERFVRDAQPILDDLERGYHREWELYSRAKVEASRQLDAISSYQKLAETSEAWHDEAVEYIKSAWDTYNKAYDGASDISSNLAEQTYDRFREQSKKFEKLSCDEQCKAQLNASWVAEISKWSYENGKPVELYFPPDHQHFYSGYLFGRKLSYEAALLTAAKNHANHTWGFEEQPTFEQFVEGEKVLAFVRDSMHEAGKYLSEAWRVGRLDITRADVENYYRTKHQEIWREYRQTSNYKIVQESLNRIQFAQHPNVHVMAEALLESFYIPEYEPYLSNQEYYDLWIKQQNNLSFIQMVTSTTAPAAFSPGGSFHTIGIEAVKFAVIPPISIILSLIATFLLVFKFSRYLRQIEAHKANVLLLIVVLGGLVYPIVKTMLESTSYTRMMAEFSNATGVATVGEKLIGHGFGVFLDLESVIYEQRDRLQVPGWKDPAVMQSISPVYGPLTTYDDWFHSNFHFLPSLIELNEPQRPYDFNLTILKRNLNVGLFMGVRLQDNQVESVSIPNIFGHSDIGFVFEHRYFIDPDFTNLMRTHVVNAGDPEYWMSIASGGIGRTSLLDKMEDQAAAYINKREYLLDYIRKSNSKGYKNLIFVQLESKGDYDCINLPEFSVATFFSMFSSGGLDSTDTYRCEGVL